MHVNYVHFIEQLRRLESPMCTVSITCLIPAALAEAADQPARRGVEGNQTEVLTRLHS